MSDRSYTLTWTNGTETGTKTITMAPSIDLPEVKCPACSSVVEAHPGDSMAWFTGRREGYATLTVLCTGCGREGFPAFYQDEQHQAKSLKAAIDNFLDHDSRPIIKISPVDETTLVCKAMKCANPRCRTNTHMVNNNFCPHCQAIVTKRETTS